MLVPTEFPEESPEEIGSDIPWKKKGAWCLRA